MADPRALVTIAGLALVADIGQYQPFGDAALGVSVFDGIDAVTIQDFGFRVARQEGSLASGGGTSPGLLSAATLYALEDLVGAWGASQSLSDSLGNAGTIKPLTFRRGFEYAVPGAQQTLYSYTLTWRWLTLTTRYGAPYTGR
jgi:hypothetical protein